MPARLTLKRVQRVLGRGGLTETFVADVVSATSARRARRAVVKRLHPNLADDRAAIARVAEEARVLASLDSPRIPELIGVGEDGGLPFLAMTYIEGCPVIELGAVSWQETLAIGLDLADALACAHAAGVVHRDLSGRNVLVDADGRAALVDFGVARADDRARITRSGAVVGTPASMSPEQARGEPAQPSSDVWAWGVLLSTLLTGAHPLGIVDDDAPTERLRKVKAAALVQPLGPPVPGPLADVIAASLVISPRDRAGDGSALLEQVTSAQTMVRAHLPSARAELAARVRGAARASTALPAAETLDEN